jgi:toxin-antitoxin system PIN domain toxin
MIFPDVNLLIYAYDERSPHYEVAVKWFGRVMESEQVFFSWHTITGFIRITTNPRAYDLPLSIQEVVSIVSEWLDRDNVHLVNLDKTNWPLFAGMLTEGQASGNLAMDAHLAAMSVSCGAKMATTDKDFSRFPGIQILDPFKD